MVKYWKWLLMIVVALVAALPVLAQDDGMATVNLGGSDELGAFLVGSNGMTLYVFAKDEPGASSCVDQCAANWPPLTVAEGERPTLAAGIPGMLGVIARADGTSQVTFNGMPLYFWVNDAQPGDATGQNFNEVWFVVQPPTLAVGSSDDLGDFLVGPNGMTLYVFANDEPGVSNCVDQCAANWPPLTVGTGQQPAVAEGVNGEVGTIERADGSLQVTYNGMPLYYWINDVVPGDTTGHNFREVWSVAAP